MNNCLDIVKKHDPDRFLAGLIAGGARKHDLWPLFAMNYEAAKTAEVVSEAMIGKIRLEWWREAIEEIYAGEQLRKREVVEPLAHVIQKHDLSKDDFLAMINVREFDLEYKIPSDWESFEIYARKCNEPLNKVALQILDQKEEADILKKIAFYYGAVGLLRTIPFQLSRRILFLPQSEMEKYNLSMQTILDFKREEELQAVVSNILNRLAEYKNVKPQSKFLKAQHQIALLHHQRLQKLNGDSFDPKNSYPIPFQALRIWLHNFC